MQLTDIGEVLNFERVISTDFVYENLVITLQIRGQDYNFPTKGIVKYGNIEYLISRYDFYLESADSFVRYQLVPPFYNSLVSGNTISSIASTVYLPYKEEGSTPFLPLQGVAYRTLANQFISEAVKSKKVYQLIFSPYDNVVFLGNPSLYPRSDVNLNTLSDIVFEKAWGDTGKYASLRGPLYTLGQGTVIPNATPVLPTIGVNFASIRVPSPTLKWGVSYRFTNIPFLSDKYYFVYARKDQSGGSTVTEYTLCEDSV